MVATDGPRLSRLLKSPSGRWRWGIVGGAALVAVVVALRARPETLYDDAAITFRYAARLADGKGFTFNDGDRTDGASAPLYTLLLAASAAFGFRPEQAATVFSVPMFGAAVGLSTWLASRLGGLISAVCCAVVLVSWVTFQNQMLSGMEVGLATVLGLGALACIARGRPLWAALLSGLALVNRLDAVFLVAAVVIVTGIVRPDVVRRTVAVVVVVVAPWFAFATWYFGSPLPFSATQKLAARSGSWDRDWTWLLRELTGRHGLAVGLLALGSVGFLVGRRREAP